jgi:mannose-6-phosphate isomerase
MIETLAPVQTGVDRFAVEPVRVEKPWGYELIWGLSEDYCGKLLWIKAGGALSLQYHRRKDETIFLREGELELEICEPGEQPVPVVVHPGEAFRIRPGIIHRMTARRVSVVLEVSTPDLEDVVRLEDRYGRA